MTGQVGEHGGLAIAFAEVTDHVTLLVGDHAGAVGQADDVERGGVEPAALQALGQCFGLGLTQDVEHTGPALLGCGVSRWRRGVSVTVDDPAIGYHAVCAIGDHGDGVSWRGHAADVGKFGVQLDR